MGGVGGLDEVGVWMGEGRSVVAILSRTTCGWDYKESNAMLSDVR